MTQTYCFNNSRQNINIKKYGVLEKYLHEKQNTLLAVIKAKCFSPNIYLIKELCQLISFDTPRLELMRENPNTKQIL